MNDTATELDARAQMIQKCLYGARTKMTQFEAGTDVIALAVVIASVTMSFDLDYSDMITQVVRVLEMSRPRRPGERAPVVH